MGISPPFFFIQAFSLSRPWHTFRRFYFYDRHDERLLYLYRQVEMRYMHCHQLETRESTMKQNLINNQLKNPDPAAMGMCVRACKCKCKCKRE